jgi:hypothetical protein
MDRAQLTELVMEIRKAGAAVVRAIGMAEENRDRVANNQSVAYGDGAFENLARELENAP